MSARICIVTPDALCVSPRTVKEADALAAAGHAVTVVSGQWTDAQAAWDAELMASRSWRYQPLDFRWNSATARLARTWTSVRHRLALATEPWGLGVLQRLASGRTIPELARAAAAVPADLLIGHNPPALLVVAEVGRKRGLPFAFDAEDDHAGQFAVAEQGAPEPRRIRRNEAALLPRCAYVTASSELTARELAGRYGIAEPITVRNCFPYADRPIAVPSRVDRRGAGVSFYWFSQTIGLNRGLQSAIRAAGRVSGDFELHLRGRVSAHDRAVLESVARDAGVMARVFFHEPVSPDELMVRTAEHDVGLALELSDTPNRANSITNKIMAYFTLGLATIASDTPGQRLIASEEPSAVSLCDLSDVASIAQAMQRLVSSPDTLAGAKQAAAIAGAGRYSWERESRKLVAAVLNATKGSAGASPLSSR